MNCLKCDEKQISRGNETKSYLDSSTFRLWLAVSPSFCNCCKQFAFSICNVHLASERLRIISMTCFEVCFFFVLFLLVTKSMVFCFPQSGKCVHEAGAGCLHAESRSVLRSCSGLPHRWLPGHPLWDLWPAPDFWRGRGIHSSTLYYLESLSAGRLLRGNIDLVTLLDIISFRCLVYSCTPHPFCDFIHFAACGCAPNFRNTREFNDALLRLLMVDELIFLLLCSEFSQCINKAWEQNGVRWHVLWCFFTPSHLDRSYI